MIEGLSGAPTGGRLTAGMRAASLHGRIYGVPPVGVPDSPTATKVKTTTEPIYPRELLTHGTTTALETPAVVSQTGFTRQEPAGGAQPQALLHP